jgi:DNA-binding MarR family transcriptional regulator
LIHSLLLATMSLSVQNPGVLLREVARLYTRAQRLVALCCHTTNTQCHILTELGRSGAQPMVDLGQRLCLEKSWVSRALNSLVEDGLVAKKNHPTDARSWIVSLTAAGKRRVDQLNETLDSHTAQLLDKLTTSQRVLVAQSLHVVLTSLRDDAGVNSTCASPPSKASTGSR